jgi:hypothetical protein
MLLWAGASVYAQDAPSKEPLSTLFTEIGERYDSRFNYLEETVAGISITPPDPTFTLPQTLAYLRNETGLIFTVLDNNFISVKSKNELLLCGYLKDKDSMEPLVSATIQGLKHTAISDANGYFELELTSKSEEIIIRFLGYRSLQRDAQYFKTNGCYDIYLNRQYQSLSQVILSNYLVEGISKMNTGDLEIDFTKFNMLPGLIETDVLQAIQAFPGVQSINETVSNINIRGGTHDQNLILWDDIKMYQSGHFFGLISVFNPQITQKVSLQKNGASADYSDGVSGTIAMQTDENINQKFKGNIGANLIDVNAFLDIPIGNRSSVQVAARKSLNDFVTTPTYEEYFQRISQDTEVENNAETVVNTDQKFNFYDTSLRWLYQISDKDHLRLNFINIDNELIFNENANVASQDVSRESSISQNSIGGGLFYQRTWNDQFQTTLQVYETDYKLKAINANLLQSQRFLQENIVSETGARVKASQKFNDRMILHMGYQFLETEITNLDDVDNPPVRTLISDVVRTHSGFSQFDFSSNDQQTNLNLGIRFNYLDKFNKQRFEPRLSFHQKFAQYFSLDIAGELKHQITSQVINFQNDFLGVEKRRWQLSNDNTIPIITSEQVSLAVNYSRKGWLLSAEGYHKNVDGITTQSQGFQNQYEFVKTSGSYQVNGVDLLLRKQLKHLNIWLSYSYMDNEYSFNGLPEDRFPSNLDITHAVTFGATYRYKEFRFGTGLNWHTGKPTTRPVEDNEVVDEAINYSGTNTSRLQDYLRLDASAIYEFKLGKASAQVGVSVWNILDEENEVNNYYRVDADNTAEEFIQNSLGLTPQVTVRVYF